MISRISYSKFRMFTKFRTNLSEHYERTSIYNSVIKRQNIALLQAMLWLYLISLNDEFNGSLYLCEGPLRAMFCFLDFNGRCSDSVNFGPKYPIIQYCVAVDDKFCDVGPSINNVVNFSGFLTHGSILILSIGNFD